MDKESIKENTIELLNCKTGSLLKFESTFIDEKNLIIKPEKELEKDELYYLIVNNNIKDKKGNVLKERVIKEVKLRKIN